MTIKLNFPRIYHRVYPVPLDDSSTYTALTDAEEYSLSGKTSYVGQIISVIDEDASSVTIYKIGTDKTLQPIGETGLSEDAVIEILHQNGYITSGSTLELIGKIEEKIPTKVSELKNDVGYLTEHQDLSDYATKDELSSVSSITNDLYSTVASDIETINDSISGLTNADKQLLEKVDGLSGSTVTINETLEELSDNTADSFIEVNKKITNLSTNTESTFTEVKKTIQNLSDNTNAAIEDVRQYIDTQISEIPKQTIYKADGKTISGQTDIDNNSVTFSVIESALTISSKQVSGLSNDLSSLETTLKEEINNKVSSVYRVKGSCKYGELPEDGQEVGDVWNVTDAHDNTPAGTNFVWTDEGWDPLGGTIDLSPYVKNDDVSTAITSIKDEIQTVQDKLVVANSNIQGLNDKIDDFKTNVENSNKAFTERISRNTDDIGELSSLTEDLVSSIKDLSESAKTFDESIKTINSSLVSINGEIDTINHSISELSRKDEQLQSKIDELTEGLNTTNSALTDAVSEIENINEIIETMMNVDASLLQDIQSLSGASTNHEERIEKLERETNTDFVCKKIFADDENVGFDEFKIEKSGNTVSITLNGFDGGMIELD